MCRCSSRCSAVLLAIPFQTIIPWVQTDRVASVWACLAATEHGANVELRTTPGLSGGTVDAGRHDGERSRGGVVLCTGETSEGRGGDNGRVAHCERLGFANELQRCVSKIKRKGCAVAGCEETDLTVEGEEEVLMNVIAFQMRVKDVCPRSAGTEERGGRGRLYVAGAP